MSDKSYTKVRDVMTPSPRLIDGLATVAEAIDLMREHGISSLVVEATGLGDALEDGPAQVPLDHPGAQPLDRRLRPDRLCQPVSHNHRHGLCPDRRMAGPAAGPARGI